MTEKDVNFKEDDLREALSEFLTKMGFPSEIEITHEDQEGTETVICNIRTAESNFLIGQHGVNLQSLQHLARLIVRKKIPARINFTLDVNSYRQERSESIIRLARSLAEEALLEKRAVVLRPMSPYERRIVHMEMAKDDRIKTESIGEGEDRRVVIKPAYLI